MSYYPTPTGVIPVSMMVAQPVLGTVTSVVPPTPVAAPIYAAGYVTAPRPPAQRRPEDESPKNTTTVFVGNILDRAPDMMIKIMLQKCGNVVNWKRVQGPTGKLPAFGFCEYDRPESTLRCLRLLDNWPIGEQRLLVKVDQKTTALLDEYKKKCREAKAAAENKPVGTEESKGAEDPDDYLDDKSRAEDQKVLAALRSVMKEYAKEIATPKEDKSKVEVKLQARPSQFLDSDKALVKSDATVVDESKKHIVTHAIKQFREQFKDEDEKMRQTEIERNRRIAEEMKRSRTSLSPRPGSRGRRTPPKIARSPVEGYRRRRRSSSHRRSVSAADDEETRERKRQDRRYREREIQYQTRLESWQARERKRKAFYATEREKEILRRKDEAKSQRRMLEFLNEYDDEAMDSKFYKGTALARKLKEREREIAMDNRDRQRERDETIELRRKLLIHHPSKEVDSLIAKHEQEEAERMQKRISDMLTEENADDSKNAEDAKAAASAHAPTAEPAKQGPVENVERPASNEGAAAAAATSSAQNKKEMSSAGKGETTWQPVDIEKSANGACNHVPSERPPQPVEKAAQPASAQPPVTINPLRVGVAKRRNLAAQINEVFREEDDGDNGDLSSDSQAARSPTSRRQLLLRPLMFQVPPSNPEEKKKAIRKLIESIPTTRSELFAHPIDWAQLDQAMMDSRVKPWVSKKIVEYIGEEEPTLTEFICQKISRNVGPEEILEDVRMVLDDEAEVFVVKMWRLIVYETEAKRNGLTGR